jgi:hypothetical protein
MRRRNFSLWQQVILSVEVFAMKQWMPFLILLTGCGLLVGFARNQAFAQTSPTVSAAQATGRDVDVNIPASQAWTDTGIDLHAGDLLQISAATPSGSSSSNPSVCDPQGDVNGSSQPSNLPVSSASPGALIGKLHGQGASPILVGANRELKLEEAGHLYLAANIAGQPLCSGSFAVKVHLVSSQAAAQPAHAMPASETQTPASRGEEAKAKLAAAAQTWLAGQFGTGATSSNAASGNSTVPAAAAPVLQLSTASLDSQLKNGIDHLPRRVNDQFQHLGDMVNFVIIGPQQKVQDALQSANWFVADKTKTNAVLNAIVMTKENHDYLQMPMSELYLFGRVQDFGYEQAEAYAVVATRHHFRLWKAPFEFNGQQVWAGAGTHDIGFEKDQRNGSVTHKIDPAVDGERDHIGDTLQKTGKTKSLTYYLPPDPVQDARNATGGGYRSDGRILVIFVQ